MGGWRSSLWPAPSVLELEARQDSAASHSLCAAEIESRTIASRQTLISFPCHAGCDSLDGSACPSNQMFSGSPPRPRRLTGLIS